MERTKPASRDVYKNLASIWDGAIDRISWMDRRPPHAAEIRAKAEGIVADATVQLKQVIADEMLYHAGKAVVEFQKQEIPDGEMGEILANSPVWKAFDGMRADVTDQFQRVFMDAYMGKIPMTVDSLVGGLRKVADDATWRLERIARTEMSAVVNTGREIAYRKRDPAGEYRYLWVGPQDGRTTEICKTIKARQPAVGLPIEELKALVREVSREFNPPTFQSRPWLPHVNCRHEVIRHIVFEKQVKKLLSVLTSV